MILRKFWLAVLFSFLFSAFVKSQNVNVGGVFPTIDHSGSLTNKLDYSLYYFAAFPLVNFKTPDVSKNAYFNLFYLEQAMTYNLTSKFSLTGSYVYQRANVVYDNYVNENRFYLQATCKQSIKKINLKYRLRFDGRFIQNRVTNETPFTNRMRYLIGFDTPINEKLYFTAYEEAFFNTFKGASVVYGENWSYVAIGKKINERNKVEVGVLYITWNMGVNSWFNQYYFQATWINHLDFRKNKS
jgi:hypothetical protein